MARLRDSRQSWDPADAPWLQMTLGLGRGGSWDEFTDEQLERGWEVYADEVLAYWPMGS